MINFICCLCFVTYYSQSFCQSKSIIEFTKQPLQSVIKTIEEHTEYVFNYEPSALSGYLFTGKIDLEKLNNDLASLFRESPFIAEIKEGTVIVYRPEASTYRICGTIKDKLSKEPLIGSNIIIENSSTGFQTDKVGFFDFEVKAEKHQIIRFSYIGYQSTTVMVQDLSIGGCPTYFLETDPNILGRELIITDYILDGISNSTEYGGFILDYEQLAKNHSTTERDILKTAQTLPGITSIDDSATNIQIRGSSPDQNLIMWEGIPIYNVGHIFGMISAINPFTISSVNVFKGAHDPAYENRVGGIIDISQNENIDSLFSASVGSTLTEFHANFEVPIVKDKFAIAAGGRQSIQGLYNSPTLQSYTDKVFQYSIIDDQALEAEQGGLDAKQTLSYYDWNAKLLYTPKDQLKFSLGTYSNSQDFSYSVSFPGETDFLLDEIKVNTFAAKANIEYKFSENWLADLSFHHSAYGNNYSKFSRDGDILSIEFDQINSVIDQRLTIANTITTPRFKTKLGYEFSEKSVTLDLAEDSFVIPEFGRNSEEMASFHNLFISTSFRKGSFFVDGGTRITYYDELKKWFHSPRVNVWFDLNQYFSIKGDVGLYHQFISQLNDFGVIQITRENPLWILNTRNEELTQTARKMAMGCKFQYEGWLFDIDAYYNKIEGLSSLSPALTSLPEYLDFAKGGAITQGVDLLFKKRWSNLNTWLNYTLAKSEYYFPEVSEHPFFAPNDIRNNLSLVASYKLDKLQFSFNTNYRTGLPYSRPIFVQNDDLEAEFPFLYFLEYQNYNDLRLPDYLRFDFNINYRSSLKKYKSIGYEVSFTLINLLNRKNISSRQFYQDIEIERPMPLLAFAENVLLDRTPLLLIRFYY